MATRAELPPEEPSQRFWRTLRNLLLGRPAEGTLRDQIEEAIDEHANDAPDADDLSAEERVMLRNLLHFGERRVDDVAVQRSDIIAFDREDGFDELVRLFREAGHSRLPVFKESLDQVIGMIHVKDTYAELAERYEADYDRPTEPDGPLIERLIRPVLYVPASMRVLDLLARMRAGRTHMAIVVDEYGGTDGLVTIEDLMEEIVGDIEDEHDEAEDCQLRSLGDGLFEADARLDLAELEERLGVALVDKAVASEVDTLGGLCILVAGRVPPVGDTVQLPTGWRLEVIEGDPRKVTAIRIHAPGQVLERTAD